MAPAALRQLLSGFTLPVCRLVLSGAASLEAARFHKPSDAPSDEYVEAIISEVESMPADLRERFEDGAITMADVRDLLLMRLVDAGKVMKRDAKMYRGCAVPISTLAAL